MCLNIAPMAQGTSGDVCLNIAPITQGAVNEDTVIAEEAGVGEGGAAKFGNKVQG